MFTLIYKKELLNQIRSRKIAVSLLVVFLLTSLSFILAVSNYNRKIDEYSKVLNKQQSIQARTRNMTVASLGDKQFETVDRLIVRKPAILSIFSGGKDNTLGDVVKIDLNEFFVYAKPYSSLNDVIQFRLKDVLSGFSRFFDFSNIIKVLFSLIALLVGYDIISGERSEGTLRLIHSNSISRNTFLLAKWAAGFSVIILAVFSAFVFAILYTILFTKTAFTSIEILRIVMFGAGSILYLLFFYDLSMLTSTFVSESKHSILIMLIVWIGVVFVIPNTIYIVAEYLYIDTPMDYLISKNIDINERDARTVKQLIKEHNNQEIREIKRRQRTELNEIKMKLLGLHTKQRNNILLSIIISPAVLYQEVSERILGTSVGDYISFMDKARMLNNIYADMYKDYFSRQERTFESRKSFNIQVNDTFIHASLDSNRLSFSKSLYSAIWLFAIFPVVNILILACNLMMYNNAKTLL